MSKFFRSFATIFMPPFQGLALVVVLYYVWAHLVYPQNDIMRGNLPDPDDYMYLAQVLDWVKGQGWYDNVQHRLDPPAGVPIHFSRLAQIPLAAGVLFFKALGLPLRGAATLTALIEPLVLLGVCLAVVRRLTAYVVPADWAGASAYIAPFSTALLFEFMPGHVDHHGLVIVLTLASIGCVLRLMDEPQNLKAGAAAGLILALTMTIALEVLPWVLLLSAWQGLWSVRHGGVAAKSGAVYALSLLGGSVAGLALTRPLATILEMDVLTYSLVYIVLAVLIAVPFVGVAVAAKTSVVMRGVMGAVLGVISGGLFLHRFPEMVTGPYGSIDPQLMPLLLDVVEEAMPLWKAPHPGIHALAYGIMGLVGLISSVVFIRRRQGVEKEKWILIALLLGAAIGLTVFYQYRFVGMASALAIIPLTGLLHAGWRWIGCSLEGRRKVFAEIGLLLFIAPVPAVILPALFDGRSLNVGVMLFAVDPAQAPCDMAQLEGLLRDPSGLGAKPLLIASVMDLGPELLFRTDDKVLAAPFHMNVQGNLDAARFLSTPYASEALNIAKRRGIDLIVACRAVPKYYAPQKGAPSSLMDSLFKEKAPSWLRHVPVKGLDDFVLYRVQLDNAANMPIPAASHQKK